MQTDDGTEKILEEDLFFFFFFGVGGGGGGGGGVLPLNQRARRGCVGLRGDEFFSG